MEKLTECYTQSGQVWGEVRAGILVRILAQSPVQTGIEGPDGDGRHEKARKRTV